MNNTWRLVVLLPAFGLIPALMIGQVLWRAYRQVVVWVNASNHVTLAVLIRQTQWLLDDVAHDLPAGRVSPEKGVELAVILESLAALVRQHTGLVVIDAVRTDES